METRRRSWACRLRWRCRSSDGFGPGSPLVHRPGGEPSSLVLGDLATQRAVVIAALVARSAKPLAAACRVASEPEWGGQAGTTAHGARAVQAFLVPVALRRQIWSSSCRCDASADRPSVPKEGAMCAWGITENGETELVSVRLGARRPTKGWLELTHIPGDPASGARSSPIWEAGRTCTAAA